MFCFAQIILNWLVLSRTPEELDKIPFFEANLEAILSYTCRHDDRANALEQAVGILDYCVYQLDMTDDWYVTFIIFPMNLLMKLELEYKYSFTYSTLILNNNYYYYFFFFKFIEGR